MKILQAIPYFNPKFGGDVNVCTNLSRELAKRNHDITIITTDYGFDSQYADAIRVEGITVIPFHCLAHIGLFLYSPLMKIWLDKNLIEFEIIHLHNCRSYQNVLIHKYAKMKGIPYLLQAHGSVLPFFKRQNLKKLYDLVWGSRILKDASVLIALTETESEQYQMMGVPRNKIEIIPNGINISEYKILPNPGDFRERYGLQKDTKIILYLGRIHQTKGLDLLIDTFNELSQEKIHCELILVGPDDGYLQQIETRISDLKLQDKIKIIGFISNSEKIQAFIDSDVFVTPSYSGFPMTFLEACACGIPIVTTTQGDHLDWIDNNVGFVVKYNSVELKFAILKLFDNPTLSKKFWENGKYLIQKEFDWKNIITSLEKVYSQSINEKVDIG